MPETVRQISLDEIAGDLENEQAIISVSEKVQVFLERQGDNAIMWFPFGADIKPCNRSSAHYLIVPKDLSEKPKVKDDVNQPSHYTDGSIEVIDFIEDKRLGFNLGNTVKYVSRAVKRAPNKHIEDLEKAQWYLNREIQKLKKQQS